MPTELDESETGWQLPVPFLRISTCAVRPELRPHAHTALDAQALHQGRPQAVRVGLGLDDSRVPKLYLRRLQSVDAGRITSDYLMDDSSF